MSALDIGFRSMPNLYVDFVKVNKVDLLTPHNVPKLTAFFVLKDIVVNKQPLWSKDPMIINGTNIVICLEDKYGHPYHTSREPLSMLLANPSIETDSKGNTIHIYRFERNINASSFYANDKSLVLKTYVEKKYENNTTRTSSIMREVVQNSDGSASEQSFYFTLDSGEIYAGPYHYHAATGQYMVGEKHTSVPHPTLKINYVSNKSVSLSAVEKALSFVNNKRNTYDFDPKTISDNYVTINSDYSVSNLFVFDLYKILLKGDSKAQKLYELNKPLFNELSEQLNVFEMSIGRVMVGTNMRNNILQTPVPKSVETGYENILITTHNVKEGKIKNSDMDLEVYSDDGVLYAISTDNQIKKEIAGKYKYTANIKFKSVVPGYIDKKIKNLQRVKAHYETFLRTLDIPEYYDNSRNKLKNSYINSLFRKYTDFEKDSSGHLIMKQTPEFHKHIDSFMEALSLIKFINQEERQELHTTLNQLINPIETNKRQIYRFIDMCGQLIYQVNSLYKTNNSSGDKTSMKKSSLLRMSFKDNKEFSYSRFTKSYDIFKNLKNPMISVSAMKKRFTVEKSRYFQKSKGDISFNTLTSKKKQAFKSDIGSRFSYLTPMTLHSNNKAIDLENFDMFDSVVEDVYDNPNIKIQEKVPSILTHLKREMQHLDASAILGEMSDFVINKIYPKTNVVKSISPMVLNYTFPLNSIVDIEDSKFNLNKQENLLLKYTKTLPENEILPTLRSMPFQVKSLFYPDNIKNPLNRIKQTSSFKTKRLIKNISFTTYRLEYLQGYQSPRIQNSFRNIHRPQWRIMQDPAKINSTSKYILIKMVSYDKFGFKSAKEFDNNQNFVLLQNKKFIEKAKYINNTSAFQKKYYEDDFAVQSFQTLNLLNNSIQETLALSEKDSYDYDWNQSKFAMLQNISDSLTPNNRSRKAVKNRTRTEISAPKRDRTTRPSGGAY